MLEFARYLKENFNEDTSTSEKIIKDRWDKVVAIIKEAFDDEYSDRRTALHRIQHDFINKSIAPSTIDVDFLKENMDYVVEKVNSLDEGEIRIVINNDVQKGGSTPSIAGIEMESAKGKRGRKKKVVEEETEEGATDNEEKVVKVSVDGKKVVVEPSENTGLEKTEHDFESEDEASSFSDSLKDLFAGFKVEVEEKEGEKSEDDAEEELPFVTNEAASEDIDGEEPEDAGEEPEDAGEEPEDAGEEPEDAEAINWEDISDFGAGEESEEEVGMSMDLNSVDLNKLIGKLVRVNENWFNVTSITEQNQIIAVGKDGKKSKINLEQIDEMEYDEPEGGDAEEECGCRYQRPISRDTNTDVEEEMSGEFTPEMAQAFLADPEGTIDEFYSALEAHYADELPPGGLNNEDPLEFFVPAVEREFGGAEECMTKPMGAEEETEEPEDAGEEPEDAGEEPEDADVEESFSFANLANRYMEEDILTPPSMVDTTGGLTKNPSAPPKKMEKTNTPEKSPTKAGPSASLTAKPGKPPKKSEKAGSVPKSDKKAAPSASLTANPSRPKQKVEKIKSPEIPKEYK